MIHENDSEGLYSLFLLVTAGIENVPMFIKGILQLLGFNRTEPLTDTRTMQGPVSDLSQLAFGQTIAQIKLILPFSLKVIGRIWCLTRRIDDFSCEIVITTKDDA